MFTFRQFNNVIFDSNIAIYSNFSDWSSSVAETLEHTTGRPVFNCLKVALRAEVVSLNALLPTTKAALIAAMTIIPTDYQDKLADKLLGVKSW